MKHLKKTQTGSATQVEQNSDHQARVILLGVDVHADQYKVVRQFDHGPMQPAQSMKPDKFVQWAEKQKNLADRVVVCYEAGTFGYTPARRLEEVGVECLVMVPINLDEGNTGVSNDRLDARRICQRLSRYIHGDREALTLVRIPTVQEEQDRDLGRQRNALIKDIRRQAERGRGYLRRYGYRVKGRWWQNPRWQQLQERLPIAMITYLERWKKTLEALQQSLAEVNSQLIAQAENFLQENDLRLPLGMGLLSFELLRLEVCDWHRFKNRRAVASMTGLCSSESSTGLRRQQGSVTKHGNPSMRWLLVEMAWRLVRYQPRCRAVWRWLDVLKPGGPKNRSPQRKKAIVAVARQLAVDIWRVMTGQTTFENLGFTLPKAKGKTNTASP